jgi:aryl-alcohol dehydrogenase-like predicted oxidoreductase
MTMLGRSDVRVPRLGVGAMTWGDASGLARLSPAKTAYGGAEGPDEEQRAFDASVAAGAAFFDTAAMYSGGASERRLGELARGRDVLIATKFPPSPFSRTDAMPASLDASLARLQRGTVDLYMHHFPSRWVSIPRLMDLLADAVESGKARAVGVSNYSAEQMRIAHAALAARGIPLASNQVEYSLLHRRPETDGVLDACRELGITLVANQPLANGALTGKYLAGARPAGLRRFMGRFRGGGRNAAGPVVALLREIGARYGKDPAQVAIRWLIEDEQVLPIPGAKNGQQAADNAGALSFSLTAAEMEALDHATAAWRTSERPSAASAP